MHTDTISQRAIKWSCAIIFSSIAVMAITSDIVDLRDPTGMLVRWRLDHTIAIVLIAATTLSVEAAVNAWSDGRRALAAGFALVATIGVAYVVFNSAGRLAEAQGFRDRVASAHNAKVEAARNRLDEALAAKARIDADALERATMRHCATHCRAILEGSQSAAAAEVESARAELAALPPPMQVGSAKAQWWADTLSGVLPPAATERLAPRIEYVGLVLFGEAGAMFGWLALRRRQNRPSEPVDAGTKAAPAGSAPDTSTEQLALTVDTVETGVPTPLVDTPPAPAVDGIAPNVDQPAPKPSAPTRKPRKTGSKQRRRRPSPAPSAPPKWEPSAIVSDLMLRAATGRSFENNTKAAEHYGYSRSRLSELRKQWKEEGALV
ncbi:hypothetical protein APY04_0812 [Hyphomicrobium sulfonivorans]|uniref:Uncharacterized protein n=1 Tax=Hyphomicrobium sulfonivorans TaxID=121290 RepID=A0A109BKZ8_HYPSL|nr:hypothetical protein [Hyphomicrobium sulfonivorans]KWT70751.1 hypothetical protein APY04_0812 [Hyphomicrobium sulfonivorans]